MASLPSPKPAVRDFTSRLSSRLVVLAILGSTCGHSVLANEELMRRGGCTGCHEVEQKLIGPAYRAVANRYRNQPKAFEQLFEKVRKGGKGNWGNVPMPPNAEDKISDADLQTLLHWILAL